MSYRRRRPQRHAAPSCGPLFFLGIIICFFIIAGGVRGAMQLVASPSEPTATPFPTDTDQEVGKAVLAPLQTGQQQQSWTSDNTAPLPSTPNPAQAPTAPAAPEPTDDIPDSSLVASDPEMAIKFQHILDRVASSGSQPGIVMLVHVPGKGQWVAARGLADHAEKTLVKPEDRFRIASLTKTFVATVVLQLVQEGTLGLDDTVEQWLPGLVPDGTSITIRHLLSHTSGLYDYLDWQFEQKYFSQTMKEWNPRDIVAHGVSFKPYFAPGEPGKWHYSNTNYILLGMIIEQATAAPLEQSLHTRLFDPLGLDNTFLENHEAIPGGFVHGYIGTDDYTDSNLSAWAAGGIVSNAEDVATFARALFTGGLLEPAMLQEMLTFATIDYPEAEVWGHPVYGMGVTNNIEDLATVTLGAVPGETSFDEVWGHIGGLCGFKSVMAYLPDEGITVVVLINQMYTPVVPPAIEALKVATGQETPTPLPTPTPMPTPVP